MAKARLKRDGRVVPVAPKGRRRLHTEIDWAKVDATAERDIARQIAADDAEARRDAAAFARNVRARTKLSQAQFARGIGVPVDTLRNWEQGKRVPRGPARALLRIIGTAPAIAIGPLADALATLAQTGYMSDELIRDRRIENAVDTMEAMADVRRMRKRRR